MSSHYIIKIDKWDVFLWITVIIHLILCPYTKVEESFNLQATHDLLFHKNNLKLYDHFQFPGVVPRTFLGPLILTIFSAIPSFIIRFFHFHKIYTLYIVRIIMGSLSVFFSGIFRRSITRNLSIHLYLHNNKKHEDSSEFITQITISRFIKVFNFSMTLLTCTQFHFVFYSSRTLPNTFALWFILLALSFFFLSISPHQNYNRIFGFRYNSNQYDTYIHRTLWLLVLSSAVFRCDTIVFAFPFFFILLITNKISFIGMLLHGFSSLLISILISMIIDSFFWQKSFFWPEGVVFHYNTFLNKSSDWGVSPFFWYFYNAIPRMVGSAVIFLIFYMVFLVIFNNRIISKYTFIRDFMILLISTCLYVFFYSFLPHKEVRFIFLIINVFNAVASIGMTFIILNITKMSEYRSTLFRYLSYLLTFFTFCITLFTLTVSIKNYPGGYAIARFHDIIENDNKNQISLHICNLAAISGVSRFSEYDEILYSKTENLTTIQLYEQNFSYLLSESDIVTGFELVEKIEGFSHLNFSIWYLENKYLSYKLLLNIIQTHPMIFILKRTKIRH